MIWWYWLITAVSIVGVVFNIKKNRIAFKVWLFTNAAWAIIDYHHGLYAQAALFTVYVGLAIWGLCEWKKK